MARVKVLNGGFLSTVQDYGRDGLRSMGVARSGATNRHAARIANALVGNHGDEAVMEFALKGATISFDKPICIAVTGAPMNLTWEDGKGNKVVLPICRRIELAPGTLTMGKIRIGARNWMAFRGGVSVPSVMGSRSTDLRAGFGGMHGRTLQKGDAFTVDSIAFKGLPKFTKWWADASVDDSFVGAIRYVPLGDGIRMNGEFFHVDPRSNRQGIRLLPEDDLTLADAPAIQYSVPVAPGTIQCPPDQHPIILGADAQTVGGYPVLGYVIEQDLERLSQVKGHERIQLMAISQAHADQEAQLYARRQQRLLRAIADRLGD